jgi:hypothetical protein
MSITPKNNHELILATREAAAAFVEDIPHVREVVNRANADRGELRRLSNVLRRLLLVDNGGDLDRGPTHRSTRMISPCRSAGLVTGRMPHLQV